MKAYFIINIHYQPQKSSETAIKQDLVRTKGSSLTSIVSTLFRQKIALPPKLPETQIFPGRAQMSVLVRCPDNPSEWGIIELQGTVVPKQSRKLNGEPLGTLEIQVKHFLLWLTLFRTNNQY